MRYNSLDLPSLPIRAFQKRPDGRILPQGGGKGDTPEAPDYAAAAKETAAGNLAAAEQATNANRANQYTPWGNLTWKNNAQFDQAGYDSALANYNQQRADLEAQANYRPDDFSLNDGNTAGFLQAASARNKLRGLTAPDRNSFQGADNWQQTITLSPEMQALFNQDMQLQQGLFGAQNSALDRVNAGMNQGFDLSGIPAGGQVFNPSGQGLDVYDPTQQTNNAAALLMERMAPELDRQSEALRTQLANQGLQPGTAAYATAMDAMGRQRNDANVQAQLQGIGLGMQQQGQTFGQGLSNRGMLAGEQNQAYAQAEQARQRAMAEQAYLRNLPLNELNALRTGNQVGLPQFPGYSQQATTAGPDALGAANAQYQAALGNSNASAAGKSGLLGGIGGAGGGIIGGMYGGPAGASAGSSIGSGLGSAFSDRRLKTNIRKLSRAGNGLNVYAFNYVWGGSEQVGYMADEVESLFPEAVGTHLGFKVVHYGRL